MAESLDFVELDRRFYLLTPEAKAEDAALESYTRSLLGMESGLGWDDLLKHRLVVVLGEPGSGKTQEFRHCARRLLAESRFGFFIRLDQLATQPVNIVLGSEDNHRFQKWHQSTEEATFFLDSVDEAKFRRLAEFYIALDRFRDAIGSDRLKRAKILLSSRISEWQPHGDPSELLERFPQTPPLRKKNHDLRSVDDEGGQGRSLLVVQLEPLDRTRIERFARARCVPNLDAFLVALDESHAWEFARRPLDVIDLANFWTERGRLGSLTELTEFNIESKLRASLRDQNDPLSQKAAREGAEALGTATVFCRRFAFKVPDDAFLSTEALDAYSCLPEEWRKEQCQALLTHPIFDSASYGQIRFHHRRVSEYLAARWLAARMNEGCPTTTLEELLFDRIENQRVIRPALAPVAAWLCAGNESWNEDLRRWVLEASPTIHLQYGDPGCLPLEYRRKILQALVRLSEGRKHIWIDSSSESLSRLADPDLGDDISAIIRNPAISPDLREEMLQLVRYGRLQGCLGAVLDVITADEPDDLKSYAAAAIRDMGDTRSRRRLADIAARMPKIPNLLCAKFCEALFPEIIDASTLVSLLRKTDSVPRYSVDLPDHLTFHLKSALRPNDSYPLLAQLIELGQQPPHLVINGKSSPLSQQFHWVGKVIPTALQTLLAKPCLTTNESETAAIAFWFLGRAQDYRELRDEKLKELDVATSRHPLVRQWYFWRLVKEWREEHNEDPSYLSQMFDYHEVLRLIPGDVQWLIDDIQKRDEPKDRDLVLRFALDLWNQSGRLWRERSQIRRAVTNDQRLLGLFRQLAVNYRWPTLRRIWYWYIRDKSFKRWWWNRRIRRFHPYWLWLSEQWIFLRHIKYLASGNPTGWLSNLAREADEENSHHWAPNTWENLQKKRGRLITWAAKEGCKRAWRQFAPPLPHEKADPSQTDHRVIVGLAGLQAEVADGEIDFTRLSDEEAQIATRYAVEELNGFAPWLTKLAASRPEAVRQVLSECIRGEWKFSPERQHASEVMHDLVWHGDGLVELVKDTVLDLLVAGDPLNYSILRDALTILLTQKEPPNSKVAAVAEQRIKQAPSNGPGFILWMAVWLQIDAQQALNALADVLKGRADADQAMLRLCVALCPKHLEGSPQMPNPSYLDPAALRKFIPLVYHHVRPSDDIERTGAGAYSPEDRDDAQNFRSSLLSKLAQGENADAAKFLRELLDEPVLAERRDWILYLIGEQIRRQAELPPWSPQDIRSFAKEHEIDPKTDHDLFKIAYKRVLEIKYDVEKSDNSLREELHQEDKEPVLRRWLARKLNERSRRRYTLPQEEEIDQRQRPDLRIENPATDPVSIEVKWTDNWSLRELLERLENQLIGQYLRAHNSHYGVYLLSVIGRKEHWENPGDGQLLTFQRVVDIVKTRAEELVAERSDVQDIAVIGIDFREPVRKR